MELNSINETNNAYVDFENASNGNASLNQTWVNDIVKDQFLSDFGQDDTAVVSLVILYIPAFLTGLLGNGFLTVIILSKQRLRNITNLFLCNLTVADLSVTIICIPVAVGQALYRIWLYGEFMCKLTGFLQGVTVAASVFTIALLSVDRYLAIRHPMLFRRLSTNAVAFRLILIVWLCSIGLMIPLLIVRGTSVVDLIPSEPMYFCGEHWPDEVQRQHYDLSLFIIVYVIPGFIICTCYGLIGSELWTENKDLKRTESVTSQVMAKQMMKGRKRVAKMLIALAVLFAVCWLPYYCVSLYIDFYPEDRHLLVALPYTIFLGHSNSALNPILYFYSSKSFRCVLVRMFKCKRRRFKPARQENMIVRCTRNQSNTTTALTRRPFIKMLSTSRHTSRNGSVRLSRSSNNSLKSSSGTNRTSFKSTTSSRNTNRNCELYLSQRTFKDKHKIEMIEQHNEKNVLTNCPQILIIESNCQEKRGENLDKAFHRREFMEATISIPTTINEESSRHNSLIPQFRASPSPSMDAIHEESIASKLTSSDERLDDKHCIEMLTFAVISHTKSADDSCSHSGCKETTDQETAQLQVESSASVPYYSSI